MPTESDQERINRLRQEQIASRNPGASKIRHYDWDKHTKKKQPKKRPFPLSEWDALRPRLRGLVIGFTLSAIIAIILWVILPSDIKVLVLLPLLIMSLSGYILGTLFEDKLN